MFAILAAMRPSDVREETEWFLTEADIDMLAGSGLDPDAEFRPADQRDGVQELSRSMQIGRVNLLDAIVC